MWDIAEGGRRRRWWGIIFTHCWQGRQRCWERGCWLMNESWYFLSKKFETTSASFFLKTDFSEKIFYFKNAIYAFLQQKSSEILRMFKIRIMTQTVIEMQFLPSQHSNAEEISSRMQKGSIFKKNVWEISFISKLCLLWFRVVIKSVGFRSVMRILNQAIFLCTFQISSEQFALWFNVHFFDVLGNLICNGH